MCDTCGCGNPEGFTIHDHQHASHPGHDHHHLDHHHHDHHHHHPDGDHDHGHTESHRINLNKNILENNNLMAERNRGYFEGRSILALNLVSSPGSGKTTLLEKTIGAVSSRIPVFVIEGDQQTTRDADRIANSGGTAIQINTGTGCHLDANMINLALKKLIPANGSILFIENVGNLVCPAMFDLGESARVVVMSVTEGDDKPLKYPNMFETSHLCLINKTDLLPYVDFSVEKAMENARLINPNLDFFTLSAKTGEGMELWHQWLEAKLHSR